MEQRETNKRGIFFKWPAILLWSIAFFIVLYTIYYTKTKSDWSICFITAWYFITIAVLACTVIPTESVTISESIATKPALIRLEYQIRWHQTKSRNSRKKHKVMQFFQMIMAISIPAIVHINSMATTWVISIFGALIAILESLRYMNQYEVVWISYREIAERLTREKFLFLSTAGPYQGLDENDSLTHLAERVEDIISIGATNETKETNRL